MLAALRRRLWLLMACLTGAVLAAALFAACRMAQGQQRQAGSAAFLQLCGQLAQQVESGAALHSGQLARFEAQHALVIRITDNGFPVSILGGWLEPGEKAALLAQAQGQAPAALPLFGAAQPWLFQANGQSYRALAARIPMARGACELLLLQDLAAEQKALRWTALTFFALFLGGLFTLCVVSRMLAGLAVRPTAKSIQRQADFVAAAGHELRSPVAAVRANLEVMAGASPPEAARCRAAALAETKRLGRLVEDLLVLAGADAARLRWAPGPVDADSVLIEACERFRPLAQQQCLQLELQLPEAPLPPVRGDAERLQQILAILLENALRYAPPGSSIGLQGEAAGRWVRFSVQDQGRGVPPEARAHIFERFYQADPSRTDTGHYGLGRAVAAELAGLHGGSLSVAAARGGGALFTLELPAAAL